ncbi:MAG: ATP-binding cassette domain-containing protein [Peptoniphilus harei]|uniref:ABC transporter ATP-binding protein/permease n=1 Tax=Peptoniphilus harei TaxID=54005 RepID=UPI00254C72D0|nr:ATP-binding cassette domain-containing protein [Peptoniphilus harei]MDK7755356.1 ATP-binding cassette domain-containing protein [Peptoniphilus harei]MDK7761591.1 ATP-binding cassette domain-containing protein [Peptoniphilus harei]MDK8271116.1 ATP-binding cassette domain-containing protein [Peptoniphilus harei]MDK8339296.1 ATP-binding cassette domain-containing protein [Peptoniphilus harei]
MFNKKLFNELKSEKLQILKLLLIKILQMTTNVAMIFLIGKSIEALISSSFSGSKFILFMLLIMGLNIFLIKIEAGISYKASYRIKNNLRERLMKKVFSFKMEYGSKVSISEVINLGVEGIEQLNLFYSALLPQLLFALIGPVILFCILSFLNFKIAIIMLLLIPLIPIAIMMVQKLAKKVVKTYWKSYTNLSEVFIDFLYGLTSLEVFNADEDYNDLLNEKAEDFRVKTMKLLMMQLNNITVLDLISYAGSALGIILSIYYYSKGQLSIFAAFSFILLSQEFFLPLRRLGALFHVAMNGITAANSLFEILDLESIEDFKNLIQDEKVDVEVKNLNFSYGEKEILKDLNMKIKSNKITAIVGESGCGKSTLAKLVGGFERNYDGDILYNGLSEISNDSLNENIMLVDNNPYFFKESLRYNLKMANKNADDDKLRQVLEEVGLYSYFKNIGGLDSILESAGNNLSGGQKQRLAIGRVLLKEPKILILDESISNIDKESEDLILNLIQKLKEKMTIILITHRLNTVLQADYIYYLDNKKVAEEGSFEEISKGELFSGIYKYQRELEMWGLNEEIN